MNKNTHQSIFAATPAVMRALRRSAGRVRTLGRSLVSHRQPAVPAPESNPNALQFVPPGHFYSPIPDLGEIRPREQELFRTIPRTLPAIEIREEAQVDIMHAIAAFYTEHPFTSEPQPGTRYHFENGAYSYADALFLYGMLRHAKPRRVVEVGSGYSSCVTLDVNERFFNNAIDCTFIEPYPELLHSLTQPGDLERCTILPMRLQEVPLTPFDSLEANDILFIDSTHVSKVGSDVNRIFFEILPRLRPGVLVHFHDVFYPFEYPVDWVYSGRAWTEQYVLRAFLQYNSAFEVVALTTFLAHFHADYLRKHMPLALKNPGGSIWLRRVG